jgi:hypothetical protein
VVWDGELSETPHGLLTSDAMTNLPSAPVITISIFPRIRI